jgi:hypothetical protein
MATRVKFLRDFQSDATEGARFMAGDVWEFMDGNARALVAEGAAEYSDAPLVYDGQPVPEAVEEPELEVKTKSRGKKGKQADDLVPVEDGTQ